MAVNMQPTDQERREKEREEEEGKRLRRLRCIKPLPGQQMDLHPI